LRFVGGKEGCCIRHDSEDESYTPQLRGITQNSQGIAYPVVKHWTSVLNLLAVKQRLRLEVHLESSNNEDHAHGKFALRVWMLLVVQAI
jgi:hypothetical protein